MAQIFPPLTYECQQGTQLHAKQKTQLLTNQSLWATTEINKLPGILTPIMIAKQSRKEQEKKMDTVGKTALRKKTLSLEMALYFKGATEKK